MASSNATLMQQLRATAPQISSVPDKAIEQWQAEIATLKASKRLKWKGSMQNQTGVLSVVRYSPAGVEVLGVKTHSLHKLSAERKAKRNTESDWLPVLSFTSRDAALNYEASNVFMFAPSGAREFITEMRPDST